MSALEQISGLEVMKAYQAETRPHGLSIEDQGLMERYGLRYKSDLWRVKEALAQASKCRGCKGQCRQNPRYIYPRIEQAYGETYVVAVLCPYDTMTAEKSRSAIPGKYIGKTFADYLATAENADAIQKAKWYADKKPAKSLFFYGATGTGKTFLAAIVAQEFIAARQSVEFGDVPTLLDEIKKTFEGKGAAADVLAKYQQCDLLVLDDLGVGQITEWNVGQLYQIINARYNAGKRLLVTSNYDLKMLDKRLAIKDDFTARRITSRLQEMCVKAFFGTKDRRLQK